MNSIFSKKLDAYLLTTAELLDSSENHVISEIIRASHWKLEENVYHDNWDGGIDYHNLTLYVPTRLFKDIQGKVSDIEVVILKTISQISRDITSEGLQCVIILPQQQCGNRSVKQVYTPSKIKTENSSIPKQGCDVFISHLATYKEEAKQLKEKLKCFGISSFVAHEDIEPTAEWQDEIENALRNAKCLVALLKDGFRDSAWTDQEVGFAYARGIKIIPVMQGVAPYGFIGKIQGLKCDSRFLWWEVYKRLPFFENEHKAFFHAIANTSSFTSSVILAKIFRFLTPLNSEEIEELFQLSVQNKNIRDSYTFWASTTHSIGMFEYLKRWTNVTYTLINNGDSYKYAPQRPST